MTRTEEWRRVATAFHRIAHHVAKGNLPADFEAGDLARLPDRVPLSVHSFPTRPLPRSEEVV